MNVVDRLTRMVELEPDRFKRMDMIRYLGKVEQQLRELERER